MQQQRIECPAEVTCDNGPPVRFPGQCCHQCGKDNSRVLLVFKSATNVNTPFSISVVGISQSAGRLGEWSPWTECSKSCGGGRKARVRKCLNVDNADYLDCIGDMKQIGECNMYPCPGM